MKKSDFVIITARRLTSREWQAAIDAQDFLVRLVLDRPRIVAIETAIKGELGGEPISFSCRELDLTTLGVEQERLGGARFAFLTPTSGNPKPCTAGGMALWAYAVAAGGRLFDPIGRSILDTDSVLFRQHLDGLGAAAFGRAAEYDARYPSSAQAPPGEIVASATLLA